MSTQYHLTPHDIAEMTMAQIFSYWLRLRDPQAIVYVDPDAVDTVIEDNNAKREWWYKSLPNRLKHHGWT